MFIIYSINKYESGEIITFLFDSSLVCVACSSLCCLGVFMIAYFPVDKVYTSHTSILGLMNAYVYMLVYV